MPFEFRPARPADIAACIDIRGKTRENAVSATRLAELGITEASWSGQLASGELPGEVCCRGGMIVGYCFAERQTGEIIVLALLPEFEGQGLGRRLLQDMMAQLQAHGHQRLFLGCASDPRVRSHGFYRSLGWRSTGKRDKYGDEELEYRFAAPC
ncbi:ribosomal protein S18 acetylase RimI-like enzyme [Paucibacter oligotrophus]|uniref:Ribosomal protein S18 acetylase RimI-like enzyme n=1 Tax=Roseateles oligotrophus TaxID=1769250 RepID=A0A840LBX4_9BURK|nr:GNAT family N-acetyltransferase [Roseateles oligotrophus]MBB4845660.1 ribosomal protein S18 acetylase RimI-like enzyme [Roseateles oligotrophus]